MGPGIRPPLMEFLRPGFLLAGGLFALLPLVLHLLVPRTRERRVLPTVRFLTPSARTRIRVQRRPTDLRLLALRMAFAFLLGAAFAGVHWHGWGGGGTETLLVVDGGERLGAGWPGVREAVSERWSPGDPVVVVDGVDVEGGVRLRRGVPSDLEELVRLLEDGDGASPNTLAVLLRALRDEAAGGRLVPGAPDSIQAVLVSGARAGMWPPGVTRVRPLLWPGSVEWIPPRFPNPIPVPSVEVEAAPELAVLLEGALASAGWRVVPTLGGTGEVGTVGGGTRDTASDQVPDPAPDTEPDTAPDAILQEEPGVGPGVGPDLRIRLAVVPVPPGDDLWQIPEESVGGEGGSGGGDGDRPALQPGEAPQGWQAEEATRVPAHNSTEVVLPDGRRFRGWGPSAPGTPGPGAMVPLFRSGGYPAAAARQEASPAGDASLCRVVMPLVPGGLPTGAGAPGLPDLMDGLLRWACPLVDPAPLALAAEVRAMLAHPRGPDGTLGESWNVGGEEIGRGEPGSGPVAIRDIRTPEEGLSLTPALLALALLLLLGEIALIRGRRAQSRVMETGMESRMEERRGEDGGTRR